MSISKKMMIKKNLLAVPGMRKFDSERDKNKRWCVYFLMRRDAIVKIAVSRNLKARTYAFLHSTGKHNIPHDEVYFLYAQEHKTYDISQKYLKWHESAKLDPNLKPSDFGL